VTVSNDQKSDARISHRATGAGKVDFPRRLSIHTVAGERNFS
jgi:hypothetical protein